MLLTRCIIPLVVLAIVATVQTRVQANEVDGSEQSQAGSSQAGAATDASSEQSSQEDAEPVDWQTILQEAANSIDEAPSTQENYSRPASDQTSFGHRNARVDLIELNHFVDEDGREVFRQVIFYDWSKTDRRYHVRAWRLVKRESELPRRQWSPKQYHCTWHDDGMQKKVIAGQMRETWSQSDPERVNRKYLPEDQRRPLFAKLQTPSQGR